MKSMKGRFLNKLKLIPGISTAKQGLVSQLNFTGKFSNQSLQHPPVYLQDHRRNNLPEAVSASIDELEVEHNGRDKNFIPSIGSNEKVSAMNNLEPPISLEITTELEIENKAVEDDEDYPSLSDFEQKCPPGGSEAVIFYTTSFRSIRKTFEDCHAVRFLLESFKVKFCERDVSMHMEFREELWRLMGGRVIPPRLFIKGRYIGGADEVVTLHEQGKLKKLLQGIQTSLSSSPCTGCGNMLFVVCFSCNGSRKLFTGGENAEICSRCPDCNENGLVKCSFCS